MRFVNGWLDVAKEYNINQNSWDRGGVPASHLVVHGTAGGSDGKGTLAYEESVGVSTHFSISTNGDIWQGVSCDRAAWGNAPLDAPRLNFDRANLNPNLWTISIEFCKPDTTNGVNITDAQKASGFALIAAICDTYGIRKQPGDGHGGIISHADINSVNRSHCPGTFPWNDLYTFLGTTPSTQGDDMSIDINSANVKNYFTETDASHWQCKNGHVIAFGILGFYKRNNGLQLLGLPLSNELYPKPGVAVQQFERGFLCYDPKKQLDNPPGSGDCYVMHVDRGFAFDTLVQAAVAPLHTQVAQLQQQQQASAQQIADLQKQLAAVANADLVLQIETKLKELAPLISKLA